MKRDIEAKLHSWKDQKDRLPLLIRGARQVGKTYCIEQFGQRTFAKIITINFELQGHLKACFDTLEPVDIINKLQLILNEKIEAGKNLLFLDEIQECPKAIMALRYFKEKMPDLHVIGAGSLLEFALNSEEFRMPVGRVQYIYMYPLSFGEFLAAIGHDQLRFFLSQVSLKENIDSVIHDKLLDLVRQYCILGGMPAVVQQYVKTKDFIVCQNTQAAILETYKSDFGKYTSKANHKYLRQLFEAAPRLVGQRFKYVLVDPLTKSRELKKAFELLVLAELIHPVYASIASGIPLGAQFNENKFKIIFLDAGLTQFACGLQKDIFLKQDIMQINAGAVAEQFVGQELIAYESAYIHQPLYFWARDKKGSSAEVDFVLNRESRVIPVEVKSGKTGILKSLKIFLNEKKASLGIRISKNPLSWHEQIISVPLYMVGEIPRLLSTLV